jgi:acyl-CoA thioester hydrolase
VVEGATVAPAPSIAPRQLPRRRGSLSLMTDPTPHTGHFEGKVHLLPIRVYYEDTDFSGVVYHANYLRYFERGRSDFLRLTGISHTELRRLEQPTAFAVIHMDLDFKRPARVDDALVVRTYYEALRGARFIAHQRIDRGDEVVAQAVAEIVCIDMDGRARRPPQRVAEALRAWFLPTAP